MSKNGKSKNKCSPQHKFPLQCSHSLWAKQSTRMEHTYKSTKKPSDSSLLQFPLYYTWDTMQFSMESQPFYQKSQDVFTQKLL